MRYLGGGFSEVKEDWDFPDVIKGGGSVTRPVGRNAQCKDADDLDMCQ